MVWIDYFILAVIALSVLLSLMRGFVREAVSLGTWIVAFWLALTFAGTISGWFTAISSQPLRFILSFAILFVAVLIVGAVVNHLFSALVDKTGLSGTDRLIGAVFGFARGMVLVAALVLVANFTKLPESESWRHSQFVPWVQPVAIWLRQVWPSNLSGRTGKAVKTAVANHVEEH